MQLVVDSLGFLLQLVVGRSPSGFTLQLGVEDSPVVVGIPWDSLQLVVEGFP